MRRPVQRPAQSRFVEIPGPKAGLVITRSPAKPNMESAHSLENGIPTERGARIRGGRQLKGFVDDDIVSMFSYNHPTAPALFAATATDIFDMTALDPLTIASSVVSGQTSGYYSTQQITTAGGSYMYAVNGTDEAQLFDAATWIPINGASTPAITGVATSDLSFVWLFKNRLFFIQKDTLVAWALPVDAIGGAATDISLAGVFQKGGSLLFGGTWSMDSGSGMDDKWVVVSTEGEVAVYAGTDPSDPNAWAIEGRYDIARPLGIRGALQAGGDFAIATVDGIVPLSQIVSKDPAALSFSAVTREIEPLWKYEANRATSPVEIIKWSDRGIMLVLLPESERTLIASLQSGAWGVATNWQLVSGTVFLNQCYASAGVNIYALDEGGVDDDTAFTFRYCGAFTDLGSSAQVKRAQAIRATFLSSGEVMMNVAAARDFNVDFAAAPGSASTAALDDYMLWDVDNWDEKLWWSEAVENTSAGWVSKWRSVSGMGYSLAPVIQITSGLATKLNVELIRVELSYEIGGAVV